MDILYLLIPFSAVLELALIGLFAWALHRGQFDDLDAEGARILEDQSPVIRPPLDTDQAAK
jgi:cbb3-type cytochrome oxidase maturation protein